MTILKQDVSPRFMSMDGHVCVGVNQDVVIPSHAPKGHAFIGIPREAGRDFF